MFQKNWKEKGQNGNSKEVRFTSKRNNKGRFEPEEQKSALENIKMLYNAQKKVIKLFMIILRFHMRL